MGVLEHASLVTLGTYVFSDAFFGTFTYNTDIKKIIKKNLRCTNG